MLCGTSGSGEGENGIQKEILSHYILWGEGEEKSQMAIFWASPFCCTEKFHVAIKA